MVVSIVFMAMMLLLMPTLIGAVSAQAMAGGAPMYAGKAIIGDAVSSKEHATPVAATQTAGMVDILKNPGLFTAFRPASQARRYFPEMAG